MYVLIYKVGFVPAGNRENAGLAQRGQKKWPNLARHLAAKAHTALLRRVNQREIGDECLGYISGR